MFLRTLRLYYYFLLQTRIDILTKNCTLTIEIFYSKRTILSHQLPVELFITSSLMSLLMYSQSANPSKRAIANLTSKRFFARMNPGMCPQIVLSRIILITNAALIRRLSFASRQMRIFLVFHNTLLSICCPRWSLALSLDRVTVRPGGMLNRGMHWRRNPTFRWRRGLMARAFGDWDVLWT